jgi:phage tail tape-measure protein
VVGSAIGVTVGSAIPVIGTDIGSVFEGFLGSWFCS